MTKWQVQECWNGKNGPEHVTHHVTLRVGLQLVQYANSRRREYLTLCSTHEAGRLKNHCAGASDKFGGVSFGSKGIYTPIFRLYRLLCCNGIDSGIARMFDKQECGPWTSQRGGELALHVLARNRVSGSAPRRYCSVDARN